jgi:hypothetical protein
MVLYIKFLIGWLTSFFVTSMIIVALRTVIIDTNCDPKFKCLCSFDCLIIPIIICTLIFGCAFSLSYMLLAKGHFQQINRYQISLLSIVGAFSAIVIFGIPLATIVIIYGGYFMIWLPVSFIFSLGVIQLSKKI